MNPTYNIGINVNRDKILIKIILVSFLLYFSQGILYSQGGIISQSTLLAILIIGFYYFIKSLLLKGSNNYFAKVWSVFLLLNIVGFLLTASISNESHFGMLKGVLLTLISFYPFYYVSRKNIDITRYFIVFFIIMIPLAIAQFYTNQASIIAERITENTNVVNNSAYLFVTLIPFLFFLKRNFISYGLFALLAFFIIEGAKRGALITGGLGAFVYLLYLSKAEDSKAIMKKIRMYSILTIGLMVIGYFTYNQFLENEFLQSRLEQMLEGETSNRKENYTEIWNAWLSSNSYSKLVFGYGFAASLEITGRHFAHNDWLEALSNFGLIGFLLYFLLFVTLVQSIKQNTYLLQERMQLIAILLVWFFMTLVSMFYTSLNSFLMVMVLATLIGKRQFYSLTR